MRTLDQIDFLIRGHEVALERLNDQRREVLNRAGSSSSHVSVTLPDGSHGFRKLEGGSPELFEGERLLRPADGSFRIINAPDRDLQR